MNLKLMNITKFYGKNKALSNFTTELTSGIYALLGPNGSGKSTLMNIITNNINADNGNITYNNENIHTMGERFREKLGFMPQYSSMYPNFSVEQFMWYIATLKGLDKHETKKQIINILQAVELDDSPHKKINSLSGGMKQRLALAQAVLGNPEILILDEPTAGLDPKQRIAIKNYISKIAFNKIVIFATHVVPDIEFIAKEIIILKKGVIVDIQPSAELTKKISDKVWNIITTENNIQLMQEKYKIINISKIEKGIELRVLSEDKPNESEVKNVAPTLEDYYLYIFDNI